MPFPKLICSCSSFSDAQHKLVGHLGQDSMLKQSEHYKSTFDVIASQQRGVSSFELTGVSFHGQRRAWDARKQSNAVDV
jgi:hypothetical protein